MWCYFYIVDIYGSGKLIRLHMMHNNIVRVVRLSYTYICCSNQKVVTLGLVKVLDYCVGVRFNR